MQHHPSSVWSWLFPIAGRRCLPSCAVQKCFHFGQFHHGQRGFSWAFGNFYLHLLQCHTVDRTSGSLPLKKSCLQLKGLVAAVRFGYMYTLSLWWKARILLKTVLHWKSCKSTQNQSRSISWEEITCCYYMNGTFLWIQLQVIYLQTNHHTNSKSCKIYYVIYIHECCWPISHNLWPMSLNSQSSGLWRSMMHFVCLAFASFLRHNAAKRGLRSCQTMLP